MVDAEFGLACGTRLALLGGGESASELPRIDAYYLRNPIRLKHLLEPSRKTPISRPGA